MQDSQGRESRYVMHGPVADPAGFMARRAADPEAVRRAFGMDDANADLIAEMQVRSLGGRTSRWLPIELVLYMKRRPWICPDRNPMPRFRLKRWLR